MMMATKMILALICSLFIISQVSSDSKNNEETSHVFNKGENSNMMHKLKDDISKYFNDRLIYRASAPTPTPTPAPNPNNDVVDCDGLCKKRCRLHSRQNVCLRACGTCCVRCNCVPPGTFGNREFCGTCYTDMTTHGNRTKCP